MLWCRVIKDNNNIIIIIIIIIIITLKNIHIMNAWFAIDLC